MKMLEKELSKAYEVLRCPSGWYKRIMIDNKGHPLAVLGRTVSLDSQRPKREFKKKEKFLPERPTEEEDRALVDSLVQIIIDLREMARSRWDWEIADRIRDDLKGLSIILEDHPDGAKWRGR